MPGAEIDIGVEQPDPGLDVGGVFVGASAIVGRKAAIGAGILVVGEKHSAAAIFAGDVEAEPMTGVVAEADAEQRRALDVLVEDDEVVERDYGEPNG